MKSKNGEKKWYFFSLIDQKYWTELRTNRATNISYQKKWANGKRGGRVMMREKRRQRRQEREEIGNNEQKIEKEDYKRPKRDKRLGIFKIFFFQQLALLKFTFTNKLNLPSRSRTPQGKKCSPRPNCQLQGLFSHVPILVREARDSSKAGPQEGQSERNPYLVPIPKGKCTKRSGMLCYNKIQPTKPFHQFPLLITHKTMKTHFNYLVNHYPVPV